MLFVLSAFCVFTSLGFAAIVNRVAYAIDPRLSLRVNKYLSTVQARRVFAVLSTYMGFRFRGDKHLADELPDQYLIMSNHQSLMDIPLYMRFLDGPRLRFVAKAELGRGIPLVSLMLRSNGHCLVKRTGSPAQAMRALDSFAERIKAQHLIPVIFPEGTRSVDGSLGTFHAAGFRRFLDKAPMPVVVCAIDGGWRVSTLNGIRKHAKGGAYHVKILKVYPAPGTKAEQVAILEEGRALIDEQLKAWRMAL